MEKGPLIGRGRTAEVYAWGSDRILKLYQAHMPTYLVEQEYHLTRAAQAAGIPAPATDQLVEVDSRCGIIFERLEGPAANKAEALQSAEQADPRVDLEWMRIHNERDLA